MALNVAADVLRAVLHRLSLWDARAVQHAHPACAEIVHDVVAAIVDRVVRSQPPHMIHAFLRSVPGFHERVHDNCVFMRTPHGMEIQASCEGAVVKLQVYRQWARVEVQSAAHVGRPTFTTLEKTLQALWWFSRAVEEWQGPQFSVVFRTRALYHHPTSEVLNSLATTFVQRYCMCDGATLLHTSS